MENLSIDIETRSSVDLKDAGAYKYAQSDDFEILLFGYKADEEKTRVIDLASGESIPEAIIAALNDPKVTKHAYNAAFEWWCLNQAGYPTDIRQWHCTMIESLYHGYPASLAASGAAIGLAEEDQKLKTGRALIQYFCRPSRTKGRDWNLPEHEPERWELFKEYNRQDVETEHHIWNRLSWLSPVPEAEWYLWHEDVLMNARGIHLDRELIEGALAMDEQSKETLKARAAELTGLKNPNSRAQLLDWINSKLPEPLDNIRKETVAELLEDPNLPADVAEVLQIRQKLGKTSVAKYAKMDIAAGPDDRIRGSLQFYGAGRTGRWAGRLVQVQNLARNHLGTLDIARNLVKQKNTDAVSMLYGNVPDTLSQLIRTAFIPSEGRKFIVSDFSAIEARIIAWLSGETWVNEVFATTGRIYEATASQMFGVPADLIKKGNPEYELRQKGKIATLALGYQGGVGALKAMGALKQGLTEEELPGLVEMWRNANPHTVAMWYAMEEAATRCIASHRPVNPVLRDDPPACGIEFDYEMDPLTDTPYLTIQLPSRRKLYYVEPKLGENRFGGQSIHFMGQNQTTGKWQDEETYSGKLVENIVQAVARDCLAVTLGRVIQAGYEPVMHIHDEIVIDALPDQHLDDVNAIFAQPIPWAPGLILKGAGFEAEYYMKD